MDLTPGFRIIDEDGEDIDADNAMWQIFDALAKEASSAAPKSGGKVQAFFPVPDELLSDVSPADWLFFDNRDVEMARRYLWLSSPGW